MRTSNRSPRRWLPLSRLVPVGFLAVALAAIASIVAPERASAAASRNVTLLAHLDSYTRYSACTGYVHHDGREYVALGTEFGTSIVNVTDPAAAHEVAFIPGLQSAWREMKQYRTWLYIGTEAVGGGVQIVRMSDPEHPVLVGTYTATFNRTHTVTVDTTRALLICNGTRMDGGSTGMRILSLADPENPVDLGAYLFDYVHDSWVRGTTLFASCINTGTLRIFDTTDPTFPDEMVAWQYPGSKTHSAETSKDGRYLFVCDEINYSTLKVFDILNPFLHPLIWQATVNPLSIVHNVRVVQDTAFVAWYTEGVRLFDVTDPTAPAEWGYYDTYPGFSGGYHGVWEVAPFFPSGTFAASDIESGLYVFRADPNYGIAKVTVLDGGGHPLPGASVTRISFSDSTATQGLGVARLALPPGWSALRVSKFGYESQEVIVHLDRGGSVTAVVLSSLSTARTKGQDAAIQSDLESIRTQAELYYSITGNNSYGNTVSTGSCVVAAGTLRPRPTQSVSGVVRRDADQAALPDARVDLEETPLGAGTGAGGTFLIPNVPVGLYRFVCRRPGYAPETRWSAVESGVSRSLDWRMVRAAWYDSCDTDKGWSLTDPSDDATFSGRWTRAVPNGTTGQNAPRSPSARLAVQHDEPAEGQLVSGPVAPGEDASPGAAGACFVTGNGPPGSNAADYDVDVGKTTLTSPPLDLAGMVEPRLSWMRWFHMNTPGEPDSMLIQISADGATWVKVATLVESHPEWHRDEIRVRDFVVPSATVRLRFIAQDQGPTEGTVEAGVDDVQAWDAAVEPTSVDVSPPSPPGAPALEAPRPNPAAGETFVTLRLGLAARARVTVFDVAGRRVRTLFEGIAPAAGLTVGWDGRDERGALTASGVYWIRADAAGQSFRRRLVRLR